MKKYLLSFLALSIIGLVGCSPRDVESIDEETLKGSGMDMISLVSPNNKIRKLAVEIADTPNERIQGLMFRKELKENQGMLFVFTQPQVLSFWMKNTLIPLDIIFFDANKEFVSAMTMQPCEADPCPSYKSERAAVYALEVGEGFIERNGVARGWKLGN
ncbi:MAG: DUF192 domain-containing protein [Patescibacteria group bacterium]